MCKSHNTHTHTAFVLVVTYIHTYIKVYRGNYPPTPNPPISSNPTSVGPYFMALHTLYKGVHKKPFYGYQAMHSHLDLIDIVDGLIKLYRLFLDNENLRQSVKLRKKGVQAGRARGWPGEAAKRKEGLACTPFPHLVPCRGLFFLFIITDSCELYLIALRGASTKEEKRTV